MGWISREDAALRGRQGWQHLVLFGTMLAMVLSSVAWLPQGASAAEYAATTDAPLYAEPDEASEVLLTIPAGASVEVSGDEVSGFLPVVYQGVAGYTPTWTLVSDEPASTAPPQTGPAGTWYVQEAVNLRSGPSTSDSVLAELSVGTPLELTGSVSGEFSEAQWNDQIGWVATIFIAPDAPVANDEPVATEEPAVTEVPVETEAPSEPVVTPVATDEASTAPPTDADDGDAEAPVGVQNLTTTAIGSATVTTGGLSLYMRSGPGTSYGVVRSLPNGAVVDVTGAAQSGFLPVAYQGSNGWASSQYLRVSTTPTTPTPTATPVTPTPTATPVTPTATATVPSGGVVGSAVVTTDGLNLNLRNAPNATATVIGKLPSGATVDVMGAAQNGYLPVHYQGTSGWASSSWLRVGSSPTPTTTPVTPTPTATPATPTPTATPVTPTATATVPGGGVVGSAVVITDGLNLNLRNAPSSTATVIGKLPSGATVDVMGAAQSGFLPVRYQGTSGWASSAWLRVGSAPTPTATPVTPTPTATPVTPTATPGTPSGSATVTTGGLALNLRSGPGTQYPSLGGIPNGAVVQVTGTAQNSFLPVRYNGVAGWAYTAWLTMGGSGTPTPTATPVTPTATPITPTPTSTPVTPTPTPTTPPGVPEIPDEAVGKATINMNVSLRRGPGTTYGTIQTLANGWKVEVMGDQYNGWTPIRYNSAKGWVPNSVLTPGWGWEIVDQMITPSTSIPMYSTPGGPTRVVQVPPGTLVDITGAAQGTWAPARWAGYSGWMNTSLMYQPEDFEDPGPSNPTQAQMIEIIYAAADKWGQSRVDMLRVARCESALDPNAMHPGGASGLFQFMPSTFAFTPNGRNGDNILDPVANADAAGWMWANGMRHHWQCQ